MSSSQLFTERLSTATEGAASRGTVAPVKSDSADSSFRDINDNAPVCGVFVTAVDIEPELELGSMIINLNCSDADTGLNANISYSLEDSYGILDVTPLPCKSTRASKQDCPQCENPSD